MIHFFLRTFLCYGHHERMFTHLHATQHTVLFKLAQQCINITRILYAEFVEEGLVEGRTEPTVFL